MIDTHAHLDFENFNVDRQEVIERFFAEENGRAIVNIGVDFKRNLKSLEIAQSNNNVFTSIGFHPEVLDEMGEQFSQTKAVAQLKQLVLEDRVVAIGETGLDYFHNFENKSEQKQLFVLQLEFALKYKLPVIIHCRNAYEDTYKIISQKKYAGLKLVMHCYCGNSKQTQDFLQLKNLSFSFTGNITFPKKSEVEIFQVIRAIPLERIMVETDCPFLAPAPMRGERNEPSFVKFVVEKIAEIKEMDLQKAEEILDKNAIEFFDLKLK